MACIVGFTQSAGDQSMSQGMTIKQDMECEARKLAEAVRDAAREFAAKTGMQASLSIDWVTFHSLNASCSESVVGAVRVELGGMTVSA
jgi:hypothetical protein